MISVIIATRNRADALRNISLPSLLRQTSNNFEVLVWDASDNDDSYKVASDLSEEFTNIAIILTYVKAPRVGLTSQRNDAVKAAKGEIVFFIDDDCAVASNGIAVIERCFNDCKWLKGMGLTLIRTNYSDFSSKAGILHLIKKMVQRIFFGSGGVRRTVKQSTSVAGAAMDVPGEAECLSGGDMALRKDVFNELCFEERLQRFGGYAMWEDGDFSHRVFLKYGVPLLVSAESFVVHHHVPGKRISRNDNQIAGMLFNSKIRRDNFLKYKKCPLLPFLWENRIGLFMIMLYRRYTIKEILSGYMKYRSALREDRFS